MGSWSVWLTLDSASPGATLVNPQTVILQTAPGWEPLPGDHSYENKGSVTIHAHWNAGYGSAPPPATCSVKIGTYGEAWATASLPGVVQVTDTSIETGFSDSSIPFTSSSPWSGSGIKKKGLHLINLSGGADRSKSYSLDAKVKMTASGLTTSNGAQNMAMVGFTVTPDDRSVSLSRQNAHNETVDSDGTTKGDTRFSYSVFYPGYPGDPPYAGTEWNWQQFSAALSGGWHTKTVYTGGHPASSTQVPDISVQWNPAYSGATYQWNQWQQNLGTLRFDAGDWAGKPDSPNTEVLTYSVTDNVDGAKADATYVLTKHDILDIKDEHEAKQYGTPIQIGDGERKTSAGQEVTLSCNKSVAVGGKVTFNDFLNNPIFDKFFCECQGDQHRNQLHSNHPVGLLNQGL